MTLGMPRVLIAFISLLLPVACGALQAQTVSKLPRPTLPVSDDGHVLSAWTTDHLNAECQDVERQTHTQLAVVTLVDTAGEPIAQYASQLEAAWKIGGRDDGRGVLLLVSIGDRKWAIAATPAVAPILTPKRVNRIGYAMQHYLRVSENDDGMTIGTQAIARLLAQASGVTLTVAPVVVPPLEQRAHMLGRKQDAVVGAMLLLVLLLTWRTGGFAWARRSIRGSGQR